MGIFKNILSKIFPSAHAANNDNKPAQPNQPGTTAAQTAPSATAAPAPAAKPEPVDVEAVLEGMQAKNSQKLNWKTSIVDLLKLLGLDSSLDARKQLAAELHYTGDTNDSAAMNIWLHKEVMRKLAENGGKLPADLKH